MCIVGSCTVQHPVSTPLGPPIFLSNRNDKETDEMMSRPEWSTWWYMCTVVLCTGSNRAITAPFRPMTPMQGVGRITRPQRRHMCTGMDQDTAIGCQLSNRSASPVQLVSTMSTSICLAPSGGWPCRMIDSVAHMQAT